MARSARALRAKSTRAIDVRALTAALRDVIEGDAFDDAGERALYAQDASNYWQIPLAVVLPRSRHDVLAALALCRDFRAPVTCRAGGTALAGQTCNHAVVFDFSRYMTRILQLDPDTRCARVEPGVICDDLVAAARPHRLTFGPKPATHDRCCFGGMLANNCGGMEAQIGGPAVNQVESLELVLYDGTLLTLSWMDEREFDEAGERPGREGEIYRELRSLRDRYADQIRARYPRIPRRISGYNLDQLLPNADGRINPARALVGTEGTCAIMLSAELRLVPLPVHDTVVAVGFPDVYKAADAVPKVLEFEPMICEGLDDLLIENVRKKHGRHTRYLHLLPQGKGHLLVKLGADSRAALEAKARALCDALQTPEQGAISAQVYDDPAQQQALWKVRESGLGATAFVPGDRDAWPGWEDSAVAPAQLGGYLRDLRALFDRYGYKPALYGHFGQGLVHCRVQFELTTARGIAQYTAFAREAAELCTRRYTGSLSGEHGDGQARAWLLDVMFGPELVQAFREFKAIWDPDGLMNPGKVVDPYSVSEHLRLGPDYDPAQPPTYFRYPDDHGSFARATLRCVGVGKCRRTHADGESPDDVMCPSYMVTHDEKHSTRGRAHLLWEMMRGGDSPITRGFRDPHVKESLDLCLACKGCKGDCPVNVDVATYKAEFLAHYYRRRLRPRAAFAFGFIDKWARLGALAPGLVNLLTHAKPTAWLSKWIAGMANEREAPRFAAETFVSWFARRGRSPAAERRVVLWPDTFNNHFHPQIARAAVEVLEAAGFEVLVPQLAMCCGRPLYDYGFLDQARRYLERVLDGLRPFIDAGLPILVLEPSCASVFRDELVNLMPARLEAQRLARQTKLLSELLVESGVALPRLRRKAIVQGHCHHKSVLDFDAEQTLLQQLGVDADVLSSGCCGMAGSFGFERDAVKQRVSDDCAERVLVRAVRAAEESTLIVANGFSCQTQISAHTSRRALHLAEVLKLAYMDGRAAAEDDSIHERTPERRAAAGLACLMAGALLAFALARAGKLRAF